MLTYAFQKNMILFPPLRISITNVCNQSCPFCFASTEMKTNNVKFISLTDIKTICKLSKKAGFKNAQLLGGEPTIHPQFSQLLELVLKTFYSIRIFSNGIFSEEVAQTIKSYTKRVGITFNIATPGFVFQPQVRSKVTENIKRLTQSNPVAISIVSTFLGDDYLKIIDLIDKELYDRVTVMLSLNLPEAYGINPYTIEQFPKIGQGIVKCVKYLQQQKIGRKLSFTNSGLRPCMFKKEELAYLKRFDLSLEQYTCHDDEDLFTISFNQKLSSYKCYPTSTREQLPINKKTDLEIIKNKYLKITRDNERKYTLPYCQSCPFYGFAKNQCSGPCMGFRINALKITN